MPLTTAALAGAIGVMGLIGWALDIESLKRIVPTLVAMNPTTATCFILIALVLPAWSFEREDLARRLMRIVGVIVGLIKLFDLIVGTDASIDRYIFAEKLKGPGTLNTNAMAPNTALNLLLMGVAWLVIPSSNRRLIAAAQTCAALTMVLAGIAVIGYLYGAFGFYQARAYFPMALHTAITFMIVVIGVLWHHPDQGLMATLTAKDLGGSTARLLLPSVTGIPLVLGIPLACGHQERRG